jgi:hypothetical protein
MDSEDLRAKLREPLAKGAVKDPAPHKEGEKISKRNILSSINPAFIVERLNDCFGEGGWFAEYVVMEALPTSAMIVVRCDFRAPEFSIERHCFGGNDNSDRGDAYKGACSDALGKVASQLGIGGDVYKGIHDRQIETEQKTASRKQKQKPEQYGTVEGIVNNYELLSPNTLWLKVAETRCRAIEQHIITALTNCLGKKVELRCKWDTTKQKTPIMTIINVLGIYEPVPASQYEPIISRCFKHGNYKGEGNCPQCEAAA